MKSRVVIGYGIGFFGLALAVATLSFHFWLHYTATKAGVDPSHEFLFFPTFVGLGIAWWGFAWANEKLATRNGQFLRDTLAQWRGGRRAYDPIVPPKATAHEGVPDEDEIPPQVGWEHDGHGVTP